MSSGLLCGLKRKSQSKLSRLVIESEHRREEEDIVMKKVAVLIGMLVIGIAAYPSLPVAQVVLLGKLNGPTFLANYIDTGIETG